MGRQIEDVFNDPRGGKPLYRSSPTNIGSDDKPNSGRRRDALKEIAGRIENLNYTDMVILSEDLGLEPSKILEWARRTLGE